MVVREKVSARDCKEWQYIQMGRIAHRRTTEIQEVGAESKTYPHIRMRLLETKWWQWIAFVQIIAFQFLSSILEISFTASVV